jgi:hypothetical protein
MREIMRLVGDAPNKQRQADADHRCFGRYALNR